jgi:hypothetical protein
MPMKVDCFICDGCRARCDRSADGGYPIEKGWSFVTGNIRVRTYCPKCTEVASQHPWSQRFKEKKK